METRLIGLLIPIALVGCSPTKVNQCPELSHIQIRDPVADANAALARGDDRLLMLGGFVGTVPGVEESNLPTRMLPGTSDTTTKECHDLKPVAEKYARTYNQQIAGAKRINRNVR